MKSRFVASSWAACFAATVLTACSSLNPFASEPKNKPAELVAFTPITELASDWQTSVARSKEFVFTPNVVGSSVYAAAEDGTLARFDNGVTVWRIQAGSTLSGGVGSNGKLVAVGTDKGEVLVFEAASGKLAWKAQLSSEILAAPAVGENMLVVRSGDARIYAFDLKEGKRLWVYQRTTPTLSLRSHVGVVLSARAVLAGFPGGKLVALNPANGAPTWEATVALPKGSTELERVADITSLPVVYGNSVCAVAYQGRVACFELNNGNPVWSREVSSSAGLDIDKKGVYVSDAKGAVLAYDRSNGASLWKQDKLAYRELSRPLAINGYVAVADGQGVIHLLRNDSGAFAARYSAESSAITADPQLFRNGLVVQSRNGNVQALSLR
ncbi:MAG: outer membrane protein assembly factor BamB [Sterolibacterium sp.]|jgi:outer membrane protein assembly factor BamB|nr:outer membrane protein assembly factor BamB [Sterolibacterium sp.]